MQIRRTITLFFMMACIQIQTRPFTIMLAPSGDAKHPGRLIEDTLERGLSLQCAELLKKKLTQSFPDIRVVLTRIPGETIKPLQNASFANRLSADIYISISLYKEPSSVPQLTLYTYTVNPTTDAWHTPQTLLFYTEDNAHLYNRKKSLKWAKALYKACTKKTVNSYFQIRPLCHIPFAPLRSIIAPALGVEASITKKSDWKVIAQTLYKAIEDITQ